MSIDEVLYIGIGVSIVIITILCVTVTFIRRNVEIEDYDNLY